MALRDGSLRLSGKESVSYRDASYAPNRRSTSSFLPAPTKGINATDPPDMVPVGYAEEITNFWPEANGLTTRGGSAPWNTIPGGLQVHSLMVYNAQTLFAVAGTSIYRCTDIQLSTTDATEVVTGLTADAPMQCVNFSNAGLAFLHCCNGEDPPIYYNGSSWLTPTFTLNGSEFDASGFTSVTSHLQRLWWTKKDSQSVFFSDTNAVQGPLHQLPLGSFMRRGGTIVAIGTITQDGLSGSDDYFVAISSDGEVFLYQGDNPEETDSFTLIGRGQIPAPVGAPRCTCKFGPDLVVLTMAGMIGLNASLSDVFPGVRTTIMDKISALWDEQYMLYGEGPGWDICPYHKRGLIMINAPDELGCMQFVVHPDTSAWVTFSGWEQLRALTEWKGRLIGAGTGCVLLLDNNYKDYVDGEYVTITARVKHSPYALGKTGIKKRCTIARPVIVSSSIPEAWFGLTVDFKPDSGLSRMFRAQETEGAGATFYKAVWGDAQWAVGDTRRRAQHRWVQALGAGYFVAPIVEVQTNTQTVTYAGVELQYEVSNTI